MASDSSVPPRKTHDRRHAPVWLLGICPLIPAADMLLKGLALGAVTAAIMTTAAVIVIQVRRYLPAVTHLTTCAIVIGGVVSVAGLLCRALFFEFYLALGLFVPLIAVNSAILARTERLASRPGVPPSWREGTREGALLAAVLIVLGAVRELLGRGSLLDGAADFFGDAAGRMTLRLAAGDGFALASQPGGAFFVLALLVTAWRATSRHGRRL